MPLKTPDIILFLNNIITFSPPSNNLWVIWKPYSTKIKLQCRLMLSSEYSLKAERVKVINQRGESLHQNPFIFYWHDHKSPTKFALNFKIIFLKMKFSINFIVGSFAKSLCQDFLTVCDTFSSDTQYIDFINIINSFHKYFFFKIFTPKYCFKRNLHLGSFLNN